MGIRLDSGDLAYLSCQARKCFQAIEKEFEVPGFGKMSITASNDLNEETLDHLNKQVIKNITVVLRIIYWLQLFSIAEISSTCQAVKGCKKLIEMDAFSYGNKF